MLGPWKIAPSCTLGLVDNSNSLLLPFSNPRLNFCINSNFLYCSSSSSFSVADEEEEKLNKFTSPSIPPNLPTGGKHSGKSKGKGVKIPSGIQVPRQKHITVSKSDLLEALANTMFPSHQQSADQLRLISSCLDSILHAEHRGILEEMRADYFLAQSAETKESEVPEEERESFPDVGYGFVNNKDNVPLENFADGLNGSKNQLKFPFHLDLMNIFDLRTDTSPRSITEESSVYTIASATRFQHSFMNLLHDAQFEELSARDLKLTSALNTDYLLTLPIYVDWEKASESNAIIFRRGYATEKQQGMLVVDKLDYLQSRFLQAFFGLLSKPLRKFGLWINERAVSRYEGFLSAVGPRGRLLRKLLSSIGLVQSAPEINFDLENESAAASESYLRPVFLPRVSLSDIWRPATRQYCGNDIWRILRVGISIIFSESVLQEPAFHELVLLYTKDTGEKERRDRAAILSLQLKIYEKIPIPDLPVVFPHKKLSFRILDMVRLDIATIVGLLAYFINYKFEDVLSSPSAILLDVIAVSALIIFVTRVALGYKQTWDRYQLLVNRTLYEKTLASGFGAVHFLLDASEQQQYKECILTYAVLLKAENGQVSSNKILAEECERFLYEVFKEKVEMPVEKAVNTLMKYGLVTEHIIDGKTVLQVIPCSMAYSLLRKHWDSLLTRV